MAAEAEFQFGAVERRLLELLLLVRERLDFEHDEGMARRVGGLQRRKLALQLSMLVNANTRSSPMRARDGGIIVVL